MWTEVVKFQPKLDPGGATRMEGNLNKRFSRVSEKLSKSLTSRFGGKLGAEIGGQLGGGLSIALLGSFAAAGVILGKHMIDAVATAETKMKGLIGDAQKATDLAAKLNTTPGELERFRALGASVGVKSDEVDSLLGKFQTSLLAAQKDITANNGVPTTPESFALKNFVGRKDIPQAFFDFLRGLNSQAAAGPLTRAEQANRNLYPKGTTAKDIQQDTQRAVFGDLLPSGLVNTNLDSQLRKLGGPSADTLTGVTGKLNRIGGGVDLSNAAFGLTDFVAGGSKTSNSMAQLMTAREQQKAREATNKLDVYSSLQDITKGVDGIKEGIDKILDKTSTIIGSPLQTLQKWMTSGGKTTGTPAPGSGSAPAGARKGDF